MDVAGHNLLKEKNLSKILSGTKDKNKFDLYQCLYPGNRTRAQTFDTELSSGKLLMLLLSSSSLLLWSLSLFMRIMMGADALYKIFMSIKTMYFAPKLLNPVFIYSYLSLDLLKKNVF